ncbi:MAG: bifunctional phosphoserine phosphatase/homoserine phosphotransferase ThrH [Propionibacteriaceae bacterium]|jgi:phosphoserine/homoserine phosphotransferase|nr:bifunctional phosphoserine phosphatase/homoserine phosphotransferase ThrH [Propionibacteriaceae bacterium]
MEMICFDLEGVFVPEIWISVAQATGIDELRLTTRDVPNYDELMAHRLQILAAHDLRIGDIQRVIATLAPLPGAKAFLDWARTNFAVAIISDTFYDFAAPLMAQLGQPLLLAHSLEFSPQGHITGYKLRLPDQKRQAAIAFRALNFPVFAVGDSYNDVNMLLEADHGFLFNPPAKVIEDYPQLPISTSYQDLAEKLIGVSSRPLTAYDHD